MFPGKLIITAPQADVKLVNRLLLHLHDWDLSRGGYRDTDSFEIILNLNDPLLQECYFGCPDTPPLRHLAPNQWTGLLIHEVERLMLVNDCGGEGSTWTFLLLDEQGARDQTVIVFCRAVNPDGDTEWLPEYDKLRVPWLEADWVWSGFNCKMASVEEFGGDMTEDR